MAEGHEKAFYAVVCRCCHLTRGMGCAYACLCEEGNGSESGPCDGASGVRSLARAVPWLP